MVLVNLRVFGTKRRPVTGVTEIRGADTPRDELRPVYFPGDGWVDTVVRNRRSLMPGDTIAGPALLTQTDTTCVLPPGAIAHCAPSGDLIVEVDAR